MRMKNLLAIGLAAAAGYAALRLLKKHEDTVRVQWKDAKDENDDDSVVYPDFERAAADNETDALMHSESENADTESASTENAPSTFAAQAPYMQAPAEEAAPRTYIDPVSIASAADFPNDEETGCRG